MMTISRKICRLPCLPDYRFTIANRPEWLRSFDNGIPHVPTRIRILTKRPGDATLRYLSGLLFQLSFPEQFKEENRTGGNRGNGDIEKPQNRLLFFSTDVAVMYPSRT